MDVSKFDFELPEERIALRPAVPRDTARMMVVRSDGRIEHKNVCDLPSCLKAGDALVVNDSRVIPARLRSTRRRGEALAGIEILLHRRLAPDRYSVLARPARKLAMGDELVFRDLKAHVVARGGAGQAELLFSVSGAALDAAIAALGEMPLPPYIAGKRRPDSRDVVDYQTIFARERGSVAAPTAGLHFTPELLARLDAACVTRETVTLHVSLGTFLPVTADDTEEHKMHPEWGMLDEAAAKRLNRTRQSGGCILAVGTTSLRTLESAADEGGVLRAFAGETDIFITPGYRFKAVDILLTNFHLPRSTLFMLASAFMGLETMKSAYAEAIREGYRFYSYGDACLLIRPS